MPEPRLLILDEPCEGLDIKAREKTLAALDSLAADPKGPTLLLVTHRIEEIPPGVTHAALMKNGRVIAAGSKQDALTSRNLSQAMDLPIEVMHRKGRMYAVVG